MSARSRLRAPRAPRRASLRGITRALIIDEPWLSEILAGRKIWELRTKPCRIRERIGLIRAGSGKIFGVATVVDSLPKLSKAQMLRTTAQHRVPKSHVPAAYEAGWRTPWVLGSVQVLARPRRYRHPSGAVTWVTLRQAA